MAKVAGLSALQWLLWRLDDNGFTVGFRRKSRSTGHRVPSESVLDLPFRLGPTSRFASADMSRRVKIIAFLAFVVIKAIWMARLVIEIVGRGMERGWYGGLDAVLIGVTVMLLLLVPSLVVCRGVARRLGIF